MSIPWMNLSRRPSEIHLKGLFILIVPKNGRRSVVSSLPAPSSPRPSSLRNGRRQTRRTNEQNEKSPEESRRNETNHSRFVSLLPRLLPRSFSLSPSRECSIGRERSEFIRTHFETNSPKSSHWSGRFSFRLSNGLDEQIGTSLRLRTDIRIGSTDRSSLPSSDLPLPLPRSSLPFFIQGEKFDSAKSKAKTKSKETSIVYSVGCSSLLPSPMDR